MMRISGVTLVFLLGGLLAACDQSPPDPDFAGAPPIPVGKGPPPGKGPSFLHRLLAFHCFKGGEVDVEICTMRDDGSGLTNVSNDPGEDVRPDWAPDGTIVFARILSGQSDLFTVSPDESGLRQLTSDPDIQESNPRWSPDGTWIAFNRSGFGIGTGIWVIQPDGSGLTKVSTGSFGRWSPDGARIAFLRLRLDPNFILISSDLYVIGSDGSGELEVASRVPSIGSVAHVWSPDGTQLAFFGDGGGIEIVNVDGTGRRPLTIGREPDWAPDGSLIAFSRSGDIWIIRSDGSGETRLTDRANDPDFSGGFSFPRWKPRILPSR